MMSWRERADRVNKSIVLVFGESAIYTPVSTGAGITVNLHFESVYRRLNMLREIDAEGPTAFARIADLPADPEPGDTITAQGKIYSVVSGEPDGYGAIRMWLREV